MLLQPLSALDLPLKVLVRAAPDLPGALVSFLTATELADRYDLPAELVAPLDGVRALVEAAVAEERSGPISVAGDQARDLHL
jgi:hypothetical protein